MQILPWAWKSKGLVFLPALSLPFGKSSKVQFSSAAGQASATWGRKPRLKMALLGPAARASRRSLAPETLLRALTTSGCVHFQILPWIVSS